MTTLRALLLSLIAGAIELEHRRRLARTTGVMWSGGRHCRLAVAMAGEALGEPGGEVDGWAAALGVNAKGGVA